MTTRPPGDGSGGLTGVAAYIALECEKGRNSGFPSVAYPSEIARRVDHGPFTQPPERAASVEYGSAFSLVLARMIKPVASAEETAISAICGQVRRIARSRPIMVR